MKKMVALILAMLLAVGMTACAPSSKGQASSTDPTTQGADAQPNSESKDVILLRYADSQPDSSCLTVAARKFAELVEEKSDGRIRVEVYSGGQLGEEIDTLSSLQMGTLDLARTATNALSEFGVKKMNAFSMPYVFRDRDHLWNVLQSDMGQQLLLEPMEVGSRMVGIMYLDEGARHFFTRSPVERVEDLKGMKIRVSSSQIMLDTVAALGAAPTPLSYSELYAALQTCTVDGAENALAGYLANKFYEVAPYCITDGHTWCPSITLMSQDTWEKLSEEDRAIIMEAARETELFNKEDSAARETADREALETAGANIVDVADKSPWQTATTTVTEKYAADCADILQAIAGM